MPPFVSSLRLVALMIFIALVAVAVWLADLRLAVALPLILLAWAIAAVIEWLGWRSARASVAVVETTQVASTADAPPPLEPEGLEPEPEPAPVPDLAPQEPRFEPPPPPPEPGAVQEPEREPVAEAEPGPERVVAAEPEPVQAARAVEATAVAGGERQPRWARRKRLRAVPPPPPQPSAPAPEAAETQVVSLPQRSYAARRWNLWDLERLARAEAQGHPERRDEWAFLFVHLRQFANADGELPTEFDSLVRESFGDLLERQPVR